MNQLAVLLNGSLVLILVEYPKGNADVGGIEKASRENHDCFHEIVLNELLPDLQLRAIIGQRTVCKQETGDAVLRELRDDV